MKTGDWIFAGLALAVVLGLLWAWRTGKLGGTVTPPSTSGTATPSAPPAGTGGGVRAAPPTIGRPSGSL